MKENVEIKIDPRNYRIHGDENKRLIHKSLVECGAGRSVLADRDNVLIAGNGVYEEAQKLGLKVRIIESDGKELVVIKRTDLSTEDEKRKLLALADNHTSDTSEFDLDLVIENFSADILNDWEFSVDDIEFPADIPNSDDEKDNNLYTKKIVSPIYTPTGNKPAISELYNLETYNCLVKQIQDCNLDKHTKKFLQIAASRHIVFDYGKIAEFYAHSNSIIQYLMENSALVIIDFKCGYTGDIIIVLDNEDLKIDRYRKNYENIYVFDKKEIASETDEGDNFNDRRAIIYARNASFEIAKEKGYQYFIELDDDYTEFSYTYNQYGEMKQKNIINLDKVLDTLIDFKNKTCALAVALAQRGDFIGGKQNNIVRGELLKRKAMNSFICDTNMPFKFFGKINEDVNTYTLLGSRGNLFFQIPHVSLNQVTTQQSNGGMTDIYLDSGTYV